jgi:hypothetical protein
MKTLSGKISFVALAIVAIAAILSVCAFAMASCQQFGQQKTYAFHKQLGGPGPNDYAELKDPKGQFQKKFDGALVALRSKGGVFQLGFLCRAGGNREDHYNPSDPHHHPVCVRTSKVTKSKVADSRAADASAANDPNTVQHLYSDYNADIQAVVDCLK